MQQQLSREKLDHFRAKVEARAAELVATRIRKESYGKSSCGIIRDAIDEAIKGVSSLDVAFWFLTINMVQTQKPPKPKGERKH